MRVTISQMLEAGARASRPHIRKILPPPDGYIVVGNSLHASYDISKARDSLIKHVINFRACPRFSKNRYRRLKIKTFGMLKALKNIQRIGGVV